MYKGMRVDAPAAISTCYAWERYQISRAQRWYAADWCRLVMERQPHSNEDSTNAEFHLPDRHRLSTCFVIAAKSLAFDICSLSLCPSDSFTNDRNIYFRVDFVKV